MSEIDDESLMESLAEDFGVEEKPAGRSALEQRILAGFEEIERFVEQHGRLPQHGEGCDIFERLYAVRLDRLRQSPECRAVLKDADKHGLLSATPDAASAASDEMDDAELQAALAEARFFPLRRHRPLFYNQIHSPPLPRATHFRSKKVTNATFCNHFHSKTVVFWRKCCTIIGLSDATYGQKRTFYVARCS